MSKRLRIEDLDSAIVEALKDINYELGNLDKISDAVVNLTEISKDTNGELDEIKTTLTTIAFQLTRLADHFCDGESRQKKRG
jgi:hypothetical protein